MYRTHIYIETDTRAPQSVPRWYGYVLTVDGRTETREAFGTMTGTFHETVLTAACRALGRFTQNCEIVIHTEDGYVAGMFSRQLPAWEANGYRTKKGEALKDAELWRELRAKTRNQKISFETGRHSFSEWLIGEMKRRTEQNVR
ncbi:MAG: hypothetical protein IJJ38_01040 [Lachnospiraceae bacterium]|nr:hypothetical protein [Lachnospiraceae bacterium]